MRGCGERVHGGVQHGGAAWDAGSVATPVPCRYWFKRNFFPQPVFERMREALVDSRLAKAPNSLNADNFGHTTGKLTVTLAPASHSHSRFPLSAPPSFSGVVIMFNLEGEKILRKKECMKEVLQFFDSIRLNGTNAYGENLVLPRVHALTDCLPTRLTAD